MQFPDISEQKIESGSDLSFLPWVKENFLVVEAIQSLASEEEILSRSGYARKKMEAHRMRYDRILGFISCFSTTSSRVFNAGFSPTLSSSDVEIIPYFTLGSNDQ